MMTPDASFYRLSLRWARPARTRSLFENPNQEGEPQRVRMPGTVEGSCTILNAANSALFPAGWEQG
jgi:hypothetical protein